MWIDIAAPCTVIIMTVRPDVDVLTWRYDLCPINFSRTWRFFEVEGRDECRDHLRSLFPTLEWDYLRQRLRAAKNVAFDETLEFEDID